MSLSVTKKSKKPSKTKGGAVKSGKQKCPEIKYELVDFVEVVTRDEAHWVKGPTDDLTDKSVIKKDVERKDKDDKGNFKQYINLGKDVEEKAKRHPEYGRKITFKARIKREDSKKEKLSGVLIKFSYDEKKADNRENSDSKIWKKPGLTGSQKPGLVSKGGPPITSVGTDANGWTPAVTFYTSAYGGDQYNISAQLHDTVKTSKSKKAKKTKNYVVWKRFWYQMTYASGFAAAEPEKAKEAYEEVFAEMINTPKKEFQESDFDSPDRLKKLKELTFMKEYQVKKKGGGTTVAVIGAHNKKEFTKTKFYKKDDPKSTPLKANLIICEHQCDPAIDSRGRPAHSALGKFTLKKNGQKITLTSGSGGSIVCNPPLRPGRKLVVKGEWSKKNRPWRRGGRIKDECITVYSGRSSTLRVKVDLSKGATGKVPVPSDAHPIYIKLKVETAESFLGESFGKGQILCVYRPNEDNAKPTQGNKQDFNNTVAHELGHMWKQTPRPRKEPDSMKPHPLQYVGHGGQGPHCRDGMKSLDNKKGKELSEDASTTITKKKSKATKTHEVSSSKGFHKNHKVKVNGITKKIKKVVDGTHLKFTRSFTAEVGHVVEQKMTDYSPVNWNSSRQKEPAPYNGTCMMFHSFSSKCKDKFCKTCKPYLQLQDMSKI